MTQRVVAVVNAKPVRDEPRYVAAVYELRPRTDGVLVYRKLGVPNAASPRRSELSAALDAEAISRALGIPFPRRVRTLGATVTRCER